MRERIEDIDDGHDPSGRRELWSRNALSMVVPAATAASGTELLTSLSIADLPCTPSRGFRDQPASGPAHRVMRIQMKVAYAT
jgi:hypothetical protein